VKHGDAKTLAILIETLKIHISGLLRRQVGQAKSKHYCRLELPICFGYHRFAASHELEANLL